MAAINDGSVRRSFLGHGNELRHLGVFDDDDIGATVLGCAEWARVSHPVSFRIVDDPLFDLAELFIGCVDVWRNHALENVVVCLCDSEDIGSRLGHEPTTESACITSSPQLAHLPFDVHTTELQEPKQRMTHQSNSATLWRGAEVDDSQLAVDYISDVFLTCSPCWLSDRLAIVFQCCEVNQTA